MKYYVMHVSNDNLQIKDITEWTDLEKAKVNFHQRSASLWNAPDVLTGYIAIFDSQFDVVEGYKEFIHHEPQP